MNMNQGQRYISKNESRNMDIIEGLWTGIKQQMNELRDGDKN